MITAPFNFVPLSEKVFFPYWSEEVSHDIPFEDGESGEIDITITAKSPMFIRNHSDDKSRPSTEFCNYRGEYFIPGSSVKGMVRNVLEIMSFSKIPTDSETHDQTMAIRDMSNSKELVGTANGCGLLKKDKNGKWIIENYGSPRTINYDNEESKTLRIDNQNISLDLETAQEKYDTVGMYKTIKVQKGVKDLVNRDGNKIGSKNIATMSNSGEDAYLILTGGIQGKKNEFVFVLSDKSDNITNIETAVEKFKTVYFETDSVDGNFWKNNWDEEIGIPVFYKKSGNKVSDIGLSQLFKLAYNYTINDATKQEDKKIDVKIKDKIEKDFALDLSQTIFGVIREKASSLKGRVQFSHFKADAKPNTYRKITITLGSPNPSFYPQYIQQNCQDNGKVVNDDYQTLMKQSARISGWKRYPLHFNEPRVKNIEPTDSSTTFMPLGTYNGNSFNEFTFRGKLRYHNLKEVELGSLISALTFHNNNASFFHNIGMAKSLGFGKIEISVDTEPFTEHLQKYEVMMDDWCKENIKEKWIDSPQLKELFVMAYSQLNIDNQLKYLKLDPDQRINEFVDVKNLKIRGSYSGRDCLPKVSKLFDMKDNYPKTLLTEEIMAAYEEQRKAEKEQEIFNTKLREAKVTENVQIIRNFIANYPEYEDIQVIIARLEEIEDTAKRNKYEKVDSKAKTHYELVLSKKSNKKQYDNEMAKFIKKWSQSKNNSGSPYIEELIKKLK